MHVCQFILVQPLITRHPSPETLKRKQPGFEYITVTMVTSKNRKSSQP